MKRSIILALIIAIIFSLVTTTFSLFNLSRSVKNSDIATKVFDISQTRTISESNFIENTASWVFMVFNTMGTSDSDYDTNIEVNLSSGISNSALKVGVYDNSGNSLLPLQSFSANTVKLVLLKNFKQGILDKKTLVLKFFYNNNPVSPNNLPFALKTAKISVKVWGTKNGPPPLTDEEIINNVLTNKWCSLIIEPYGNKKISGKVYMKDNNTTTGNIDESGDNNEVRISFVAASRRLTVYVKGKNVFQYNNVNMQTYKKPNAIVIKNNIYGNRYFEINQLDLNGNLSYFNNMYRPSASKQTFLFKNFTTDSDGSFDIKFFYYLDGSFSSNDEFSFNIGYDK